jgi:hypothetical protein
MMLQRTRSREGCALAPTAQTCQISTIRDGWTKVLNLFRSPDASRGHTQYGVTFELIGITINVANAADLALPPTYRFPEFVADYEARLEGSNSEESVLRQRLRAWPLDLAEMSGSDAVSEPAGPPSGATTLDQLANVERILSEDPTTRQAVFSAWNPPVDVRSRFPISPIAGGFRILDDQLHTLLLARSTDVVVGLVPELMAWAAHGTALAARLALRGHSMTYHCWNLHMYEIDFVRLSD